MPTVLVVIIVLCVTSALISGIWGVTANAYKHKSSPWKTDGKMCDPCERGHHDLCRAPVTFCSCLESVAAEATGGRR
jgi:hypothetical protein